MLQASHSVRAGVVVSSPAAELGAALAAPAACVSLCLGRGRSPPRPRVPRGPATSAVPRPLRMAGQGARGQGGGRARPAGWGRVVGRPAGQSERRRLCVEVVDVVEGDVALEACGALRGPAKRPAGCAHPLFPLAAGCAPARTSWPGSRRPVWRRGQVRQERCAGPWAGAGRRAGQLRFHPAGPGLGGGPAFVKGEGALALPRAPPLPPPLML